MLPNKWIVKTKGSSKENALKDKESKASESKSSFTVKRSNLVRTLRGIRK